MKVVRVKKVVYGKIPDSIPVILYGDYFELNDAKNKCDKGHNCIFEGTDSYLKTLFICSCNKIFGTRTAALDHVQENSDANRDSSLESLLTYIGSTKKVTPDLLPNFIDKTGLSELELSVYLFHKTFNHNGEPLENDVDKDEAETLWEQVLKTNERDSATPRQRPEIDLVTPAGNIDLSPVEPVVCPFPKHRMLVEWILKSKGIKLPYGIIPMLAKHIGITLKKFQIIKRVIANRNGTHNQFEEYFTEELKAEGNTVYNNVYAEYCNSSIAKSRKRERKHRQIYLSRSRILVEQIFFSKGFNYHPGMDIHLANEFGINRQFFNRLKIRRRNNEKKGIENPYVKHFDSKTKTEADAIFRRATKKIIPTKGRSSLRPTTPEDEKNFRIAKCIIHLKGGRLPYAVKPLIADRLHLTYGQVHNLCQRQVKKRNRGEQKKQVDSFTVNEKKDALELYDKAVIDVRRKLKKKKQDKSVVQLPNRTPLNANLTSSVNKSFIPTECLFLVKGCNFSSSLDYSLATCLNIDPIKFSRLKRARLQNNQNGIVNPYVKYLNETTEMSANETFEIACLDAEMTEQNEAGDTNRLSIQISKRRRSFLAKQCLDDVVIDEEDKIPNKPREPMNASLVTYSTKLVSSSSNFEDFDKKLVLQCLFHLKGVTFPRLLIGLLTQAYGVSMNTFDHARKMQIWLQKCGQNASIDFPEELKQKVSNAYDEAYEIYSTEVHNPFHNRSRNVLLKNDHHLSILSALYYMHGMNFSDQLLSELANEFGITIKKMTKIVTNVQSRNVKYTKNRERIITSKAIEDAKAIWERAKNKQLASSELTQDVDWQRDFFFKTKLSTNRNVILHVLHSLKGNLTSIETEIIKSLDCEFRKEDFELFKMLQSKQNAKLPSGVSDLPGLTRSQTKVLQNTLEALSGLN